VSDGDRTETAAGEDPERTGTAAGEDPERTGTAFGEDPDSTGATSDDADRALRRRVVAQFSGTGERAAVWRGFEQFLPTTAYLNLGYSPRFVPTVLGDSQARLAGLLAAGLVDRVADPAGTRLLDVGCGRGGPARQFASRGFEVVGVDLVAHNVALARANVADDPPPRPAFVVGDATALPLADDAVGAATAVDALAYLPEKRAAFEELARVLAPGGWVALADLLAADDAESDAGTALSAFADAWDVAPVAGEPYRDRLRAAGFTVDGVEDVTAGSTARFRKYSRAFLALADGPAGGAVRRLLGRWDVDPGAAIAQVRAAHRALPHLRHEVVYARLSK
jgi:ubiquinone/menaquinone biosynthesis C-methylase UbiE